MGTAPRPPAASIGLEHALPAPAESTPCPSFPTHRQTFQGHSMQDLVVYTHKPIFGIVTAMWKRHELTDLVFSNIASLREKLKDEMELIPVVAGSEGELSQTIAERNGFRYIDIENQPLGRKWNAALSLLRHDPIDGVIIMGSDDLLNEAYFRMIAQRWRRGEKIVGLLSMYFLEQSTGRMYFWPGYAPPRTGVTIGLGRFIHKEYIDLLEGELWENELTHALDTSMGRRIKAAAEACGWQDTITAIPVEGTDIMAVDVKSSENMWGYENIAHVGTSTTIISNPMELLEKKFSKKICDRLNLPPAQIHELNSKTPAWSGVTNPDNIRSFLSQHIAFIVSHLPFFELTSENFSRRFLVDVATMAGLDVSIYYTDDRIIPDQTDNRFFVSNTITMLPESKKLLRGLLFESQAEVFWFFAQGMDLSKTKSILWSLRKENPDSTLVADVRGCPAHHKTARLAIENADLVCQGPDGSHDTQGKPCVILPSNETTSYPTTTSFNLRRHIAVLLPYSHSRMLDQIDEVIRAYLGSPAVQADAALHFNGKFRLALEHKNITFYKSSNYWVTGFFYRVCITPEYFRNDSMVAALIACGIPVLRVRPKSDGAAFATPFPEELSGITVPNYEEAFAYASVLYTNRTLWEKTVARGKDAAMALASEKKIMTVLRDVFAWQRQDAAVNPHTK